MNSAALIPRNGITELANAPHGTCLSRMLNARVLINFAIYFGLDFKSQAHGRTEPLFCHTEF
jgi:hypothetical protein